MPNIEMRTVSSVEDDQSGLLIPQEISSKEIWTPNKENSSWVNNFLEHATQHPRRLYEIYQMFKLGFHTGVSAGRFGVNVLRYLQSNQYSLQMLNEIASYNDFSPELPLAVPNSEITIPEYLLGSSPENGFPQPAVQVVTFADSRMQLDEYADNPEKRNRVWPHERGIPAQVVKGFHESGFPDVMNVPHGVPGSTSVMIKEKLLALKNYLIESDAPPLFMSDDGGNSFLNYVVQNENSAIDYKKCALFLSVLLLPSVANVQEFQEDLLNIVKDVAKDIFEKYKIMHEINRERIVRHKVPSVGIIELGNPTFSYENDAIPFPDADGVTVPLAGPLKKRVVEIGAMVTGASTMAHKLALYWYQEFVKNLPPEEKTLQFMYVPLNHLTDKGLFDGSFHYNHEGAIAVANTILEFIKVKEQDGRIISLAERRKQKQREQQYQPVVLAKAS